MLPPTKPRGWHSTAASPGAARSGTSAPTEASTAHWPRFILCVRAAARSRAISASTSTSPSRRARRPPSKNGKPIGGRSWRAPPPPDHILVVDREGTIQRMNRPPEVTPLDAVIGHSIFEFAAEESHESLREALRAVFECGENRTVEGRTIGPSGESYWHSNAIGPVRIGDRVVAAVVVARNVTERKEAEERLRKSEAHWRALVESAPSFIVTVDREGVISSVNREIDGGVPEDAVGHTIFEFAAEGAHETWRDALRDVFEHGERVQIENQASLTNGTMRWWACTVGPVREGDAVTSAVLVSHDITERREAEERLRAVATAVPDVIAVLDAEGTFIEFLVGSSNSPLAIGLQTELRGRNIDEFLPVKTAEWVRRFIRRTIRSNELQEAEDLFDLPAGKRWVMGRGAPLTLGDGTKAVVIHALDVTERKEMEQELQKLREDLEAQAQARLERGEAQGLTFREITVLSLISRGKSDKEIAALLGLSRFTVSKHAASIVKKMRAANRTEAVGRAVRDGVI
ncbi:MAG: PAS domain S-box protein [Dehalococcoidia bacterium]